MIPAGHRLIGGDLHHVQAVNGLEFLLLRQRRTGHTGELIVQAEEILEGNGSQGLAFTCHLHPLLGLDGLVEALVIAAAVHQSAGKLVNNDDLAVLNHIVDILLHQTPGLHGLVQVMGQCGVLLVGQVLHTEELFGLGNTAGGEGHGAGLLVHKVVAVVIVLNFLLIGLGKNLAAQGGNEVIRHLVKLGGILTLAGDDQRRSGLVDEDRVHLVHDGEGMAPLNQVLLIQGHIVTEVVKTQLIVGAIGNVRGIALPPLGRGHAGNDQAGGQAHIAVDLAHHLGLILGQVIINSDQVDTVAGQSIQVQREYGGKGLAFAGLHFRNTALVQHNAAHQLDGICPQAQHPVRGLTDGSKSLGQNIVQGLAFCQPLLEQAGLRPQFFFAQGSIFCLHGQDLVHRGHNFLYFPLRAGTKQFGQQSHKDLL